jgi:hypothetical protein
MKDNIWKILLSLFVLLLGGERVYDYAATPAPPEYAYESQAPPPIANPVPVPPDGIEDPDTAPDKQIYIWQVVTRFSVKYKLYSPGGLPSSYGVEILHLDVRNIRKDTKPTLDDVDWQPPLQGFELFDVKPLSVESTLIYPVK